MDSKNLSDQLAALVEALESCGNADFTISDDQPQAAGISDLLKLVQQLQSVIPALTKLAALIREYGPIIEEAAPFIRKFLTWLKAITAPKAELAESFPPPDAAARAAMQSRMAAAPSAGCWEVSATWTATDEYGTIFEVEIGRELLVSSRVGTGDQLAALIKEKLLEVSP